MQELPVRGQPDSLAVVTFDSPLTSQITLIDTPDLDGDNAAHHAAGRPGLSLGEGDPFSRHAGKISDDRARPVYRMAARYAVPSLFVMNKVEEEEVAKDYCRVVNRVSGEGSTKQFRNPTPEIRFNHLRYPARRRRIRTRV